MINDIKEYYYNLTKLQRKKFEVILENLYIDSNDLDSSDVIIVIKVLRIYVKTKRGRKINQLAWNAILNLTNMELFNVEYMLNENLDSLKQLYEPNINIKDYNSTYSYLLDLFNRVFK